MFCRDGLDLSNLLQNQVKLSKQSLCQIGQTYVRSGDGFFNLQWKQVRWVKFTIRAGGNVLEGGIVHIYCGRNIFQAY